VLGSGLVLTVTLTGGPGSDTLRYPRQAPPSHRSRQGPAEGLGLRRTIGYRTNGSNMRKSRKLLKETRHG
jgi:hypothetical protein